MDLLIKVDFLQVGVEWIGEAGPDEVGSGVVGKAILVELAFEVLQRKGVIKL